MRIAPHVRSQYYTDRQGAAHRRHPMRTAREHCRPTTADRNQGFDSRQTSLRHDLRNCNVQNHPETQIQPVKNAGVFLTSGAIMSIDGRGLLSLRYRLTGVAMAARRQLDALEMVHTSDAPVVEHHGLADTTTQRSGSLGCSLPVHWTARLHRVFHRHV